MTPSNVATTASSATPTTTTPQVKVTTPTPATIPKEPSPQVPDPASMVEVNPAIGCEEVVLNARPMVRKYT